MKEGIFIMPRLILHVGPAKCGSTSIQHFFSTQNKPCSQSTRYTFLNPVEIAELNCEKPSASIINTFKQLFLNNLIGCDVLVWSHEYLFQCPFAIKNICSLAKSLSTKVSIIGYSRKQSDFFISEYSQWGFRAPNQIKDGVDVLEKLKLDPVLFSGLEQRLIASIVNDFNNSSRIEHRIYDWYNSYKNISQLANEFEGVTKCGVLPNKESDTSLIKDFCEKSGLTLCDDMKDASSQIINVSFNQDIVEAIYNAVAFGLDMPGPHDNNEILELLTTKMNPKANSSSEFLSCLKSYIDTYFSSSNLKLCQEYSISEAYFAPAVRMGKQEIMDIIIQECQQRALNKSSIIREYQMLSARLIELCLTLTYDFKNY